MGAGISLLGRGCGALSAAWYYKTRKVRFEGFVRSPTSGLYTDPNPVTFGPFRPFRTPITVTVTDHLDATKNVSMPLTLPDPTLTISTPQNFSRVENGPGFDDDTFTFDIEILGANGGPGWKINSNAISPNSGDFGITTFTLQAPLIQGTFVFEIVDRSYRNVSQPATIKVSQFFNLFVSGFTLSILPICKGSFTFLP